MSTNKFKTKYKTSEEIREKFDELKKLLKYSDRDSLLENFATLAMFIFEVAGEDITEEAILDLTESLGPIEINDEEIFLQDLDLEIQEIENLAEYIHNFIKTNREILRNEETELAVEVKEKWLKLKEKITNYFEEKVGEQKKEIYKNTIKEIKN